MVTQPLSTTRLTAPNNIPPHLLFTRIADLLFPMIYLSVPARMYRLNPNACWCAARLAWRLVESLSDRTEHRALAGQTIYRLIRSRPAAAFRRSHDHLSRRL